MLSSPAATGSKGERLALGRRPIGCETQPDLVFARACENKQIGGCTAAVFTEPVFWNPSGIDLARPCSSPTRKLHNRLHTHRTRLNLQVDVNTKAPTCGAFGEPSDGLEPSAPSLPSVAPGGNGFSLVKAIFGFRVTATFATGCAPSVPCLFHSNRPQIGSLKLSQQA
jgi:hypothetical protein